MNGIFLLSDNIWCAIISGAVSLLVAVGSFQVSVRKDREKAKNELQTELKAYYEKNRGAIDEIRQGDLQEIKDDVSNMGANLQQKIAIVELTISTLSDRVEKHNNVLERMFKLEQRVDDLTAHAK